MSRTRVILLGGFLGAGKTTLMAQAAERLARRGLRVGMVTNDQATHLVDTELLIQQGFTVGEVGAGCFCCRFEEFVAAADALRDAVAPDVLLAEPVGSCTDLAATVLHPLRRILGGRFDVAPLTVVVDPQRLLDLYRETERTMFPETVTYIVRKQMEEADILLLNKADGHAPEDLESLRQRLRLDVTSAPILTCSALRGEGIDHWLDRLDQTRDLGGRVLDIDYDQYAAGEAELGWLNAEFDLVAAAGADWKAVACGILELLRAQCRAADAQIGHVKLIMTAPGASLWANLVSVDDSPFLSGSVGAERTEAHLNLNARAALSPEALRQAAMDAMADLPGGVRATCTRTDALRPGRPVPVHRYSAAGHP